MSVTGCTRWCCSCDIAHLFAQLLSVITSVRDQLRTQCTSAGSSRRSVKPWSWKCGKVNFNTALTEVCLHPPPPPTLRHAPVGTLLLHQPPPSIKPALDCVSHKKAESRAASHCGILWNQLARTPGHTSSSYTSYFCPTKAAAVSFRGNLLIIWSPLPLS